MKPPPLAVWLMESFRAEAMRAGLGPVGSTPWCPEWTGTPAELVRWLRGEG